MCSTSTETCVNCVNVPKSAANIGVCCVMSRLPFSYEGPLEITLTVPLILISLDLMSYSQLYPWKLCLIKYELDINVYKFQTWLYFQLWFLFRLGISSSGKQRNYHNLNLLNLENYNVFNIIDQITTLWVPLLIRHCHLCMNGHWKLHLPPLSTICRCFVGKIGLGNPW